MVEVETQSREEQIAGLLPAISKQDKTAIKQFFDLYSDEIYNYPLRYNNLTEDEAGDFYLYAFEKLNDGKKLSKFQGRSKFRTWFYSVLRNLVIDFLRTQKGKIKTTAFVKVTNQGELIDLSQKIADVDKRVDESDLFEKFSFELKKLMIDARILFKLAYIHYLELNNEEVEWLIKNTDLSHRDILVKIVELKNLALEKSSEVKEIEDKLTSNFQAMNLLRMKLQNAFKENPQFEREEELWSDTYECSNFPIELNNLIQSYTKKIKKQQNLVITQKKSLLSIRVPYKKLTDILGSSQGVLSVKLLRIIEKLNKSI